MLMLMLMPDFLVLFFCSGSPPTHHGGRAALYSVRLQVDELPADARAATKSGGARVGHVPGRGEWFRVVPRVCVGGPTLPLLCYPARNGLPVDGESVLLGFLFSAVRMVQFLFYYVIDIDTFFCCGTCFSCACRAIVRFYCMFKLCTIH